MNSLAVLTNLFSGDGLIIMLILLLLFGAKKLPELAKGLGSAVREFSKAKDEIEHEITRPAPVQIQPPPDTQPHVATSDFHEAQPAVDPHAIPAEPAVITSDAHVIADDAHAGVVNPAPQGTPSQHA